MSDLWTNDVSLLYSNGRLFQLFPTPTMTYGERVNSLVRLALLSTVCVYLYNRDSRYLLYGLFCVAILTVVARVGRPMATSAPTPRVGMPVTQPGPCTHPTPNNPFANVLLTDYKYNPDRPPACNVDDVAGEIKAAYAANVYRDVEDVDMRSMLSFYTVPDTSTYQAGREAFAAAVYGTGPTCKEDQSQCGKLYA